MEFVSLNNALTFTQSPFLNEFIKQTTESRSKSSNKIEERLFKDVRMI